MEAQRGGKERYRAKEERLVFLLLVLSTVSISRERSNKRGELEKGRVRITTSRSGVSSSSV